MGSNYFPAVAQKLFSSANSYNLMAIPMFILAGGTDGPFRGRDTSDGLLPGACGEGERRNCLCLHDCGTARGGILGMANAEAALLSSTIYPEMRKDGYEDDLQPVLLPPIGGRSLIPPGLLYVIYGVSSGTPIAYLFEAGVVPGIMVGLALALVILSCRGIRAANG